MPADDLVRGIALDALRPGVPARHDAARIEHEQGIVGDPGDEQAELPLAVAQRFERRLFDGHVAPDRIDETLLRRHRPVDRAPRAVAMTEAAFEAHRHAFGKPGAGRQRTLQIVRMAQIAEAHVQQLAFAPAEQPGPGRVDADELAGGADNAEEIARDLPDALALARAPRHLGLEPVVQPAQHLLVAHPFGGLDAGDENAADPVRDRAVRDRAVADREPRLFDERVFARDGPRVVLGEEGAALALEDRLIERAQLGMDLRPYLGERPAQRTGMPAAQDGAIGVVVDLHQLRPPAHRHREARGEDRRDAEAQAGRPGLDGAERRLRPVHLADAPRHLARDRARHHQGRHANMLPAPEVAKGARRPSRRRVGGERRRRGSGSRFRRHRLVAEAAARLSSRRQGRRNGDEDLCPLRSPVHRARGRGAQRRDARLRRRGRHRLCRPRGGHAAARGG
jgi:hypothetical protein